MRAEGTFSEAARHLETTAASCETDWLLAFAANNKKQPGVAAMGPAASAAFQAQREGPARPTYARRPQPPTGTTTPAVPRAPAAPPPAAPRVSRKWSSGWGASPTFARRRRRRRREPGVRCGRATPEMASAGGGDCEGAGPEADRPHQRPFLIGVSGGTASGKVRGWAARRGLRVTLGAPGLCAACRASVQRETPASSCCEVLPTHLPGVDRAGGGRAGAAAGQAGSGSLDPGAPPQAPGWPGRSWPPGPRCPYWCTPAPSPPGAAADLAAARELMRRGGRLQAGLLFVCFPVHCVREDHGAAGTE